MFREARPDISHEPFRRQVHVYWDRRDSEYKVIMPNAGPAPSLPSELVEAVEEAFSDLLSGYSVLNRGTRIEIRCSDEAGMRQRDDALVRERLQRALGDSFPLVMP